MSWRRELPEFISVVVDGEFGDIDVEVTERMPGRVTVVMLDFTADAIAHALIDLGELADRVRMDRERTGERELAAALQEAAEVAGYRCPGRTAGEEGSR